MRRNLPFIIYLACLSALSGWLMSRMSWLGKFGINLLHKEYKFLKTWYKGAAVVFGVLIVLFILQSLAQKKMPIGPRRMMHIAALLLAAAGLFLTYDNFQTDISHSLLKERFHLGAYLFWFGWMSTSIFFLTDKNIDIG